MKKSLMAAAVLVASTAFAVKPGGTLFIKSKDTKVLKDPKASAASAGTLQPGEEVTWVGPSDKDKTFHEISTAKIKKGYVLQANLSPSKPAEELDVSTGKAIPKGAIASNAAATKALSPAGINYAKGSGEEAPKALEAAAEIIYTEEHNKLKGTDAAIAAKSKALGGGK